MVSLLLRLVWVVLVLSWAGGMWAAVHRRRRVIERDLQEAAAWREASRGASPSEDPVLVSLGLALTEGLDPRPTPPQGAEHLPPGGEKG